MHTLCVTTANTTHTLQHNSTFITIALVDKYGRRTLLTYSAALMATFCAVIAILSSSVADYKNDPAVAALIVIFCALYVVSFAFGWGPVGWIVPAEIFPLELRGKGESLLLTII
jgi:MFS transporter, SP family, sugar:H+ symporter